MRKGISWVGSECTQTYLIEEKFVLTKNGLPSDYIKPFLVLVDSTQVRKKYACGDITDASECPHIYRSQVSAH